MRPSETGWNPSGKHGEPFKVQIGSAGTQRQAAQAAAGIDRHSGARGPNRTSGRPRLVRAYPKKQIGRTALAAPRRRYSYGAQKMRAPLFQVIAADHTDISNAGARAMFRAIGFATVPTVTNFFAVVWATGWP